MDKVTKIVYKKKNTFKFFLWKIEVYKKEVKEIDGLTSFAMACEQMEKRIRNSKLYQDQQKLNIVS